MAQEIRNITHTSESCPCCRGPIRQVTPFTVSDTITKIADDVIFKLKLINAIGSSATITFVFGLSSLMYIPVVPLAIGILGIGAFIHKMSYTCPITFKLALFLVNERLQINPNETIENLVEYVEKEWNKFFIYKCTRCESGE